MTRESLITQSLESHTLDPGRRSDHNGHMKRTLKESKAKLSELVELACQGQEILITVRGRVKARLVPAEAHPDEVVMREWINDLADLGDRYVRQDVGSTIDEILDELREERL